MTVTFVIGVAGAGKSEYIRRNFKTDTIIVDLFNFQNHIVTFSDLAKSYDECMESLKNACKTGSDVVLEHTLLKKCRRIPYINAVREITDCPINIVVINPPIETITERQKMRKIFTSVENIENALDVLEIPELDEGYDSINIISR